MKSRSMLFASAAAMSLLLSGCSIGRALGFYKPAQRSQPQLASVDREQAQDIAKPASANAQADVNEGRTQLAAANYGMAIEAFRKALASGNDTAAALNGLGVAYAGIGRQDLAERYFRQALSVSPSDQRYADNLAIMLRAAEQRSRLAAMQADFDAVIGKRHAPEIAKSPDSSGPKARLQQVSPHNFVINTSGTSAPTARPAMARTTGAKNVTGFRPLVRIVFATPRQYPATPAVTAGK